ncbi:GNAT family N-acetyltransferase [Mesorhizobium sp. BH1-1-5]|uniref:GNAT family N-acetyltransferase n=1 Tax=Mesorhizobium sp. BH1-1-5 TaxID=2876661 RepID=UPI001CCA3607|nr:GNAT family N-acetyltransferase [Mesorhizobium sp. BH1-1-5]MBZ9989655.1 GNAT family N-acetyltransferase [Mesorhizobium sp. BH1-1-5]
MNATFVIRPAGTADHDQIAEVWHESASLPTVGPATMPTLQDLRRRVDVEFNAGWDVAVAARDGEVIGFVAIKPREAVLDQLFVRPDTLGAGIGQALLQHAIQAMPSGFTLYTRSGNFRARRFYEKAELTFLRDDLHPRNKDPVTHYGWKPV